MRTRPKQRLMQRESILLFGEGAEDKAWLRHLTSHFANYSVRHVSVECGFGGSPKDVVYAAQKQIGAYDKRIVILDGDRPPEELERAEHLASKGNHGFMLIKPCMEAMQLEVLEPTKRWRTKTSSECKSHFERSYVPRNRRTTTAAYQAHFRLETLVGASSYIADLEEIIGWITTLPL